MRDANPVRAIMNARRGPMPREEAIDALTRCARAVHAGVDCPLGALVVQDATSGKNEPGPLALRRAAQRVIDGTARTMADPVLVGAVADCCAWQRAGGECPLGFSSPQPSVEVAAVR